MKTLADRIRGARREAQYSRQIVAQGVGVSASAVGQWEHPAGTTPSPENMIALAGFLKVSLDWLVFGRIAGGGAHGPTAVDLTLFAQDAFEEHLLAVCRSADAATRSMVLAMLTAMWPAAAVVSSSDHLPRQMGETGGRHRVSVRTPSPHARSRRG
jgi:transcriptional regulator with XRE-family HTH domain